MRGLLLFAVLLAVSAGAAAQRAALVDRIVAIVNKEVITASELSDAVSSAERENAPKMPVRSATSAGAATHQAQAIITKHGRRVANVRAEAWQEDRSKPIAAMHGHFLLR